MDPRHPEQAISRMRELMKQYDRIEADMNKATTYAKLAQLEREGGLVVQEICLVAPRIHEAMMQTSRQRRHDLSKGNIYDRMREYAATAVRVDDPVEKPVMAKLERPLSEEEGKKIVESISTGRADEPVEKPVEELVRNNLDVIGEENIGGESVSVKKLATKNATKKKATKKAKK